jgi:dCTP diphosphatase
MVGPPGAYVAARKTRPRTDPTRCRTLSAAEAPISRPTAAKDPTFALALRWAATVSRMHEHPAMQELKAFMAERDWAQFHSPENLAKSIAIEAGELLECFQWGEAALDSRIEEELADVLTYCYLLADRLGVSPDDIVLSKLNVTRGKYPVDKARGRSAKYDEL